LTVTPRPRSPLSPYTTLFRSLPQGALDLGGRDVEPAGDDELLDAVDDAHEARLVDGDHVPGAEPAVDEDCLGLLGFAVVPGEDLDRKSTRLNSSHVKISYAVF